MCDKSMPEKKNMNSYESLYLKRRNWSKLPSKMLLASIRRELCFTKGHLRNHKWVREVEYPPHQNLCLALLIQIKKKLFFSKRAFFNYASDLAFCTLSF